jgi:hypothetical protein
VLDVKLSSARDDWQERPRDAPARNGALAFSGLDCRGHAPGLSDLAGPVSATKLPSRTAGPGHQALFHSHLEGLEMADGLRGMPPDDCQRGAIPQQYRSRGFICADESVNSESPTLRPQTTRRTSVEFKFTRGSRSIKPGLSLSRLCLPGVRHATHPPHSSVSRRAHAVQSTTTTIGMPRRPGPPPFANLSPPSMHHR